MPYTLRLIAFQDAAAPAYRQEQPFGQVPVLQDGGLTLFESGAILMHLAERSAHHCSTLLPAEPEARARVTMWMFAALNSVEPYLAEFANLAAFHANEAWAIERRPAVEEMALKRLRDLDMWLEGRDWLADGFSAADILMTTVLRLLDGMEMVEGFGRLNAYKDRCMARPAFRKALADQVALYAEVTSAA